MLKIPFCALVFLSLGCANIPKVQYSQLQTLRLTNAAREGLVTSEYFLGLISTAQGFQTGDQIFKRNSAAYWILPEIDKIDLDLIAQEEAFKASEYQSRLKRIREVHENYLVFSIDLRMPFYPKWTQSKLLEYLKSNLVITLENGTKQIFAPELLAFNVIERFSGQESKDFTFQVYENLEVRVPVRVQFKKQEVISAKTKEIVIKLRLLSNPPYRIGFFDEKFFQAFKWEIDHAN